MISEQPPYLGRYNSKKNICIIYTYIDTLFPSAFSLIKKRGERRGTLSKRFVSKTESKPPSTVARERIKKSKRLEMFILRLSDNNVYTWMKNINLIHNIQAKYLFG